MEALKRDVERVGTIESLGRSGKRARALLLSLDKSPSKTAQSFLWKSYESLGRIGKRAKALLPSLSESPSKTAQFLLGKSYWAK